MLPTPAPWPLAVPSANGPLSPDNQFQHYLQATPLGVLVVAQDGTITFANPSAHACFGYSLGELLGQAIETLLPISLRQRHVQLREGYLKKPEQRLLAGRELYGRRQDGSEVPVAVGLTPLPLGGAVQVVCTVMDLTELKRAERDLVRFFDLSPDLFCIASLDGRFRQVNANFSRVLGYPKGVLLSRPFLDFVHPEDRAATLAELARLSAEVPVVQFRHRYRDSGGDYHWLEWTARSLPEEGTLFAVARDVSERVRMEQELLAREERERAILDNTAAVVYVKDPDGRYQFVNRRHVELFSLDRTAVIGKEDHEIFPKEIADEFQKNDRRVLATGETLTIQEVAPHADGDHTYVSVKFPLFDGTGRIAAVAGISTDITDQLRAREAEQQLRLARVFQQRLYPAQAPSVPGLDVAGSAVSVSQVCGDYFDYVVRSGGRLAVCVGDVSGHGFGPALQMVEVRATLRLLLRGDAGLHRVVEELNRLLCVDLPESSFVSLFLTEVDVKNRTLHHVGAGHQGLLFRADGGVTTLDSTGPVLGVDAEAVFAEPSPTPLGTGELLLLFTDGLTDAMNLAGEVFGTRRLVATVQQHRHQSSQAVLEGLFAAVYDFARGRTIQDDMTAVAVKVVG